MVHFSLNNPCIMINRRTPGSLLIFPQFDNRVDRITLVTMTNTNCDMSVDSQGHFVNRVDVHYNYVGKYGPGHVPLPCLESDRTIHLSPCDTFTMYTSFDNPQMEEGYIYAYAVSPTTGEAISYNFLIGQEIVFASFENDEDAVNAIVFHAIPPYYQPTDLDHDNIRDLDGVEYDQAPDQILIPRFLGQDPPGTDAIYRSQLYRLNVPAEDRSPSRRCADLRSVGWKVDIERALAPHQLKERPVLGARKFVRDASSVRVAHFLSIDGRTLCLFGVGVP